MKLPLKRQKQHYKTKEHEQREARRSLTFDFMSSPLFLLCENFAGICRIVTEAIVIEWTLRRNTQVKADVGQIPPIPLDGLNQEINKAVVGRQKEIKLLLAALLSEGHVLLEDLPGMGKTTLVKSFAKALSCTYRRIQCTPDLLPSDVIGLSIYNPKTGEFSFKQGPLFTQILLVDEINRALPRTQSSLLEGMEERQVTIDGKAYPLNAPFMVLATQNPIDMEGTFPLPEAQLDRFLFKLRLGYPTAAQEEEMLERTGDFIPIDQIAPVLDPARIQEWKRQCEGVYMHPSVRQYIVSLAGETRSHPLVSIGVSPRASKALYKAAKAWACLNNRTYVLPDDIKDIGGPIWSHRLLLKMEAKISGIDSEQILKEIFAKVPLPEEALASERP
jgi:MoxR-like ATPase